MKSSRNTSTSGKPASGRRTPARKTKAKKKTTRTMPVWMRNTLALIVVGVFSHFLLFRYPPLFLSLEGVLRTEGVWRLYPLWL